MKLETPAHETHIALTDDGWHVALWRYIPRRPFKGAPPVILCHGLGANRFNLDFNDKYSLARYLARKGFDSFVVELRGSGLAGRLSKAKMHGRRMYNFDDHAVHDVPTVIDAVQSITGHEHVHWVGHSMGGMLAYVFMGTPLEERVRACVVISAPADFGYQRGRVVRAIDVGLRLFPRHVPAMSLARLIAPFSGIVRTPFDDFGPANFRNMTREVQRGTLKYVIGDISRGQLLQAKRWVNENRLCSADGKIDYLDGLENATTPTLFLVGSLDRLAPPASVRIAYDKLGSEHKKMIVIGKDSGLKTEYGHVDILLGRDSPTHVFPKVADWITRYT